MTHTSTAYAVVVAVFVVQALGAVFVIRRLSSATSKSLTAPLAAMYVLPIGLVVAFCAIAPRDNLQEKIVLATGLIATSLWFAVRVLSTVRARRVRHGD